MAHDTPLALPTCLPAGQDSPPSHTPIGGTTPPPTSIDHAARLALFRDDIQQPFSPVRFAMDRAPVDVGHVDGAFGELPCCLDMLIHLPGGPITVPAPWNQDEALARFLAQAFAFEDTCLPTWRGTHHAYLTFDQRTVPAHRTHRNAGWHFDGMQGSRYPVKLPVCHQYLCADALPTEFSAAPTQAHGLDETQDNWFVALGRQAVHDPALSARPMGILAMTAYQLHRSPKAVEPTRRTFVRLDISLKQQDRAGNTPNPELTAPWAFVARALPPGLEAPIQDAGWA